MILGFTKVSDDAYLARLRQTRDKHLKRIQELEEKIQEDRRHDRDEQDSS